MRNLIFFLTIAENNLQFFSQSVSNPLNNLNITSSIPPLLQRQNSAPVSQPPPQQQQQQFNDFHKPNNVNKPPSITSVSGQQQQQQQPDFQRKYSLPINSTAPLQLQQPPPSSSALTTTSSSSHAPQILSNIMARKQSAPTLTSIPATNSNIASAINIAKIQQQQQQQQQLNNFQQVVHGSPSRARDRNLFEKVPSSQDVMQLPLLKGYIS